MGEGNTWRINNDYLSGTYADTFINSLQMTYLAVVVLTCVCCVNVQTLRWSQMFGRHLCALINSMHAHAVHAHTDARTLHMYAATATHRFTYSHTHTGSHLTSSGSHWGGATFSLPACWYLSCQLSKPTAGSRTDLGKTLQSLLQIFNLFKRSCIYFLLIEAAETIISNNERYSKSSSLGLIDALLSSTVTV